MATPKQGSASYSAFLRAKRQARQRSGTAPTVSEEEITEIQIGNWVLADQDGDLVVIHRDSGETTILMKGHGS